LNVSYHALTGDLNQVSFSSIRSGTIEEREHWMTRQDWMISSILEPIYLRWLDRSLAVNAIPNLPKLNREELFSRFRLHTWRGRRWPWVDPLRDIEATIMAVNAGFKSPQQAAADLGVDVESVLADIARFNQMAATAGLGLTYGQTVPTSPKPPGADNGSTQA
jgi:lambda family phage portal protein